MSEISKAALKAIEKCVSDFPENWISGICAFMILNRKDGKHCKGSREDSGPCHYGLSLMTGDEIVVNAHKPDLQGRYPDFIKWVSRESPFSHGVLNKNNEDELLNHASVIDVELVGTAGCLWLCKAFRYAVEEPFRIKTWRLLKEQGLNGLQAFIGASILTSLGEAQWRPSHASLFSYGDPETVRKYYDTFQTIKKLEGFEAAQVDWNTSSGYTKVWGSLKHKVERKPDGWGGYIEIKTPVDVKEYAQKLKEIFEGDPKNVKP